MKCPKCNKEIDKVVVVSECWQYGRLKDDSNEIIDYGSVESIDITLHIDCPECLKDIRKYLEE